VSGSTSSAFERFVGIDYSGAETPTAGLTGLRMYVSTPDCAPSECAPPGRTRWTRELLARELLRSLRGGPRTLIGIDHGFSFPLRYFDANGVARNWDVFLADFQRHWPTDDPNMYVDFVRDGLHGDGAARSGETRWRRAVEKLCGAKSVFHFDVPGSVAKSTHAGLPWLLDLRRELGRRAHFWPFDGWRPDAEAHVFVEAYPSLWSSEFEREGRTPDQHDAWTLAEVLRRASRDGRLERWFEPRLAPSELEDARVEGWILGVDADTRPSRRARLAK